MTHFQNRPIGRRATDSLRMRERRNPGHGRAPVAKRGNWLVDRIAIGVLSGKMELPL